MITRREQMTGAGGVDFKRLTIRNFRIWSLRSIGRDHYNALRLPNAYESTQSSIFYRKSDFLFL